MHLHRDLIVSTAVALLNEYGLADTTMRRVATTLSVAPGALYWHINNKQALIAAIADYIVGPVLDAPATDATELSRRLRQRLLAFRDGAEVVSAGLSQVDNPTWWRLVEHVEQSLAASVECAAVPESLRAAATALIHLTVGATTFEQSRGQLAAFAAAAPPAEPAEPADAALADAAEPATSELERAVAFIIRGLQSTTVEDYARK
ncbi:helix-turn-helix transcriptional regulator [Corynebacterium lizhenjunii]|uniref:Helix-turn-helix transcriptional regulator n=1 Tax=Corynebacterium lizhenjunii TaxID=2709394 RepID=A0A7T0KDW7_9CORY|nr:TetR family transcriptional regulator [Corynebacterium lizhenjunii]QPK78475.1 helix-turn-helix transcriptional regulator [Corynebacterium lizhenjunii]